MTVLGKLKGRSEGTPVTETMDLVQEIRAERVGGSTIKVGTDGMRHRLDAITERKFAVPVEFVRRFRFPDLDGWDLHRLWSLIACMKPFAGIRDQEQEIEQKDLLDVSHRSPDSLAEALERILMGCRVEAPGHEMDGRMLFKSLRNAPGEGWRTGQTPRPGKILYRVDRALHYMLADAWVYVPKRVWWRVHSRAGIDLLLNACAEAIDVASPEFRAEITMDNIQRYAPGWTTGTLAAYRASALMPIIESLNAAQVKDLVWRVESFQTGGRTTKLVVIAGSQAYASKKPTSREISAEIKRENAIIRRERAARRQAIAARKAAREAARAGA